MVVSRVAGGVGEMVVKMGEVLERVMVDMMGGIKSLDTGEEGGLPAS